MISILDYGMGNLRSVAKAFEFLEVEAEIVDSVGNAEKLVIPGVGAFGAAMDRLGSQKREIRAAVKAGLPILGICLGQQLLFEKSEEHGEHVGLELLAGNVEYFPPNAGVKVPHMGWNALSYRGSNGLAEGGEEGEQVYFVHSLIAVPEDEQDILATSHHGIEFAAAVQRENVWGCQFHPEKSSAVGMRMLRAFALC